MACIGIDCRFAALPVGLGTYTRGIVPQVIDRLNGHHIVVVVRSKTEDWLSALPEHVRIVELSAKHYSLAEQIVLPRRLKQLAIDLWYVPHFNVPLFSRLPFVSTVHDLTLHRYPNTTSLCKRLAYRLVMRHAVLHARSVIAVSACTANDVYRTYGIQPTVVTEGVDDIFKPQTVKASNDALAPLHLPSEFFLYVGGNKQHKNVQLLIDAHAKAATKTPLVLVTSSDAATTLQCDSDVIILSDLPTTLLPYVYSRARCLVTASLYEGFCLPVLEARACGCPVIATNVSAIPEVSGPHTRLVEPTIEALSAAMQSPPTKAEPPSDDYDWGKAAAKVSAILVSALDG